MSEPIDPEVVLNLLRAAVRGERDIVVLPNMENDPAFQRQPWDEMQAGNVTFEIDGWKITIFNDCDSVDYIETVVAPDGRTLEWDLSQDAERNIDGLEECLKAAKVKP